MTFLSTMLRIKHHHIHLCKIIPLTKTVTGNEVIELSIWEDFNQIIIAGNDANKQQTELESIPVLCFRGCSYRIFFSQNTEMIRH